MKTSQISPHMKAVKIQVRKMLRAGLDSEFICSKCNVSRALVKEWEEDYLKELLENGAGQRARIRDMLLRNSPQMINTLYKMAIQDVDSKLQVSAATTFLNFATRFLKEDASITAAETKIAEKSDNLQATLFDFSIPGEEKRPSVFDAEPTGVISDGTDSDDTVTADDLLSHMVQNDYEQGGESDQEYDII